MRSLAWNLVVASLLLLPAVGCNGQGEQPLIEGPVRSLEVKTGESSREGGGNFIVPVHGKLYRDYLLVTYNSGTVEEHTEVIPAHRLWKVEFGTKKVDPELKGGSQYIPPPAPSPTTSPTKSKDSSTDPIR
jgi:hypothetical protein